MTDTTLELAPRGTRRHRAALEMARNHWPDDPPSHREVEVLVAVHHRRRGRVVGAVSLDSESDVPDPPGGGPWLVNLVVDPACRNQGIGTRLLRRAAARWAPEKEPGGVEKMWRAAAASTRLPGRPATLRPKRDLPVPVFFLRRCRACDRDARRASSGSRGALFFPGPARLPHHGHPRHCASHS